MAGLPKVSDEDPDVEGEDHAARGARMLALREAVGMTQQELATAAGLDDRTRVIRIEKGRDRLTSQRVQEGLGTAIGVTGGTIADYARGHIDLAEVMRRRSGTRTIERETRYPIVGEWMRELRGAGEPEELVSAFEAEIGDYKSDTGPTQSELQEALRRARRKTQGKADDAARREEIRRLIAETAEIDPKFNRKPILSRRKGET